MMTIAAKNCLPTAWKAKLRGIQIQGLPGQNQFKNNVGNLARLYLRTKNDKGTKYLLHQGQECDVRMHLYVHLWTSTHMYTADGEDQRQTLGIFFSCFPLGFWNEVCDWTWNYWIDQTVWPASSRDPSISTTRAQRLRV